MSKKSKDQSFNRETGSSGPNTGKKGHGVKWGMVFLFLLLLVAGVYFYADFGPQHGTLEAASFQEAKADAGATVVSYPVTMFADGRAHQFRYKTADGRTIRYFVLKSSDGVIRAAFDACDVCWPEDKGYHQDGDYMVCKNCGKRFQSTKVNVVTGGCNPSALDRNIKDGQVVIQAKHIEEGKRFFSGRSGQGRG